MNKKLRYAEFNIEEFVEDKKFIDWVISPDPELIYFWERWLIQNPEKVETVNQAKRIISLTKFKRHELSDIDKEQLWKKLHRSKQSYDNQYVKSALGETGLIQPAVEEETKSHTRNKKLSSIWYYAVAVSIAVLIAIGAYPSRDDTIEHADFELTVKSNPAGQKSMVYLPDGSIVHLNSESILKFPDAFGQLSREVQLEGEAYFEVAKNASKPFRVHSAGMTTTALGTSFNIKAYKNELNQEIALVTGKIIVEDTLQVHSITLNPGESITYDKSRNNMQRLNIDIKKMLNWKDGLIEFTDTDIKEAIRILERWYGVKFKIMNLTNETLTCSGKFQNEYLDNILKSLSYSLSFSYEIQGKEVKIEFN